MMRHEKGGHSTVRDSNFDTRVQAVLFQVRCTEGRQPIDLSQETLGHTNLETFSNHRSHLQRL